MIQLKKAWSDLRLGGGRTVLMLVALILGVWGLGSVALSARILGPDLRQNFLGTAPPHAVLSSDEPGTLDPQTLGEGVESAEFRDLSLLRIEVKPDEWIPLWLFAVEDFTQQKVAKLAASSGAAVPPAGTMLIERDGLLISNLKIGSVARVRAGDRNIDVPVSGIAFDPAQAPATQDHFIYAYCDPATWSAITGQQPGKRLLVRLKDVTKQTLHAAVEALKVPPSTSVTVPPFEEHPHQWQLNLLVGIIGAIGLLAFLLSAVMVGQATAALVARQVRQIGILKAVGASNLRIAGMYSLYLGSLALAAGLVSIPLALVTGRAFADFVAKVLNFNILTTSVPLETWLLLLACAAALPFLFAAPSLLRASRITVRAALADVRVVAGTGPQRGPWAIRNLLRRPGRTAVVVGTLALGVAIFLTGFNVRESLSQFLQSTSDAMRFDLQVVLSQPVPREVLAETFAGVSGIERTELWTGGRGELQSRVASAELTGRETEMGVVSLPWNTVMAAPRILSGRWLTSADSPEVLLNEAAVPVLGQPRLGQTISVNLGGAPRSLTVVGFVEEIDKPKIYMSDALWAKWDDPAERANTLTMVAKDRGYDAVLALKKDVERAAAASKLKVLYVISQAERTKIIADHLDIVLTVLVLLASLVLWVATLGSAAASSITVMERTREIGILRAIGGGPNRIVGMFVLEGVLASAAGLLAGLALAGPLSQVASSFFGTLMLGEGASLRFAWSPLGVGVTVIVTLALGALAAWGPAQAAVRISTRKALAYD